MNTRERARVSPRVYDDDVYLVTALVPSDIACFELSWESEAHGGQDLAGNKGALLVVAHELAGLVGDLVKDV